MDQSKQAEQLSALMDDELSEFELRRLLRHLDSVDGGEQAGADGADTWHRYHLIGAVIRGETLSARSVDIAAHVRQRLADEAPLAGGVKRRHPAWLKPLAGAAIAASVATLTVLNLSPTQPGEGELAAGPRMVEKIDTPAVSVAGPPAPAALLDNAGILPASSNGWRVQTVGTHWQQQADPRADGGVSIDEKRLNRYLLEHSEFERQHGVGGFMPYASFVGYDPR